MSTSLNSLPIEVRQKIYSLVLVETEVITIQVYDAHNHDIRGGVARHPHSRNSKHRREVWRGKHEGWVRVISSNAELLRVSKQVHADAAPIFYGSNRFSFFSTNALDRFLNQIGGMKPHLRHISLPQGAFTSGRTPNPQAAVHRSLKALVAARDLRSLSISPYYFCVNRRLWQWQRKGPHPYVENSVKQLFKHCKPLLQSLKISYKTRNLVHNFLDIITINPVCAKCQYYGKQCDCYLGCPLGTHDQVAGLFKKELATLLDSPQD